MLNKLISIILGISAIFFLGYYFISINNDDQDLKTHEVRIKDHKFLPEEIRVKSGEKFKINVFNDDDSVEEFESNSLHREKIIPPGGSVIITIPPLEKGIYDFFGEFNPESAQGRIIVE